MRQLTTRHNNLKIATTRRNNACIKFPHKKIRIACAPTRGNKMSAWSNNVLIEQDSDEINDLEYVPVARHIPRAQTITEEYFESS